MNASSTKPAKRYEFHPIVGHTKAKPVTFPSVAAFDHFWEQVRPHLSEWVIWSDEKTAAQYLGFLNDITPEQVAAIAKEAGDKQG